MPQSKEVHRDYMRERRGSQKGSQVVGFTKQGSQIEVGTEKAAKLLMIAKSLNKSYIALDGKKGKLSDLVRYGITGPTMTEVGDLLDATG